MKKMLVAIVILGMIFAGLLIYRNNPTSDANSITVQEINEIEKIIYNNLSKEELDSFISNLDKLINKISD